MVGWNYERGESKMTDISIVCVTLVVSGNVKPILEYLLNDNFIWDVSFSESVKDDACAVDFCARPGAAKIFGRMLLDLDDVTIWNIRVDAM